MELKIILVWYLLFFAFGIIGLPISSYLFKNWQDKGYAFAKYIGLFIVGIFWWFFSSVKILPFTPVVGYILFALALVGSIYWLYRTKFKLTKYMLIEEGLFFLVFIFWTWIRSTNPRAEGTEKMMNLAFMNSLDRTRFMPPLDTWLAEGGNINYYYLGHYFFVVVGKLGSIAMSYVYNLALVTIIAQTFVGLFSLFLELFKRSKDWIKLSFAILGATWISFAGNLHMFYGWITAYINGQEWTYFFPDSTRIISFTINEFPAYSIVLGDVHGHYLALPYLVLVLSLALVSLKIKIGTKAKLKFNLLISILIVALYGINSWDMITAVFIFSVIHLYQVASMEGETGDKIKAFVLAGVTLLFPGIVVMLPYIVHYSPAIGPEGGFPIGIVPFKTKSEPLPWIQFWFQFLIAPLLFMLALKFKVIGDKAVKIYPMLLTAIAVSLIVGVEFVFLKDIFHASNPPYFRTNTVFKFYYHAWVIFGVAAVSFIYLILDYGARKYNKFKLAVAAFAGVIFVLTFSYIFVAIEDFYPWDNKEIERTMDGIDFIQKEFPEDYQAIEWINENIDGQPVILEEVGDAYTYAARISTTTGLPTVIGWPTHEWQWRGNSELPFGRKGEVDAFYNGLNSEEIDREFLQKYNVEYIYVGKKERTTYSTLNEEKIANYGEVVFEQGTTKIYQVNIDE